MTREPDHFTPDAVDEQLDEVAQQLRERDPALPGSPTLHVVADLQRLYDQQARVEGEARQRVRHRLLRSSTAARYLRQAQAQPTEASSVQQPWRTLGQPGVRLGQHGGAPVQHHQQRNGPGARPGFRQERQDRMLRIFHTGQHWSARAITLVAVALLVVLVGGLALGLLLGHQTTTRTSGGPKNQATGTATSTPYHLGAFHEFPLPSTPTSGAYRITSGPDGNLWFTEISGNAIGRITPAGSIQEFARPTSCGNTQGCGPDDITSGPDGNLWFTDGEGIGRITPAGSIQEFTSPPPCGNAPGCAPLDITSGPDGNLWFTEPTVDSIGRITPAGSIQEFALPITCGNAQGCGPYGITSGPDGNLWFTEISGNTIGRITPTGSIQEFALPTTCGGNGCGPYGITSGPDGNLWFTEAGGNSIGRITTAGKIQEFALPSTCGNTEGCSPDEITRGPDGNLWFTEGLGSSFGRITPAGKVQQFTLPTCGIPQGCSLLDITSGPDGHLWFTENGGEAIGEVSP